MGRKIILNLAISLDGYISDDYGGFEWIKGHDDKRQDTERKFIFNDFFDSVDLIVMGRKAFEDCGVEVYEKKKVIVATSQVKENYDNVTFVNKDICKYVQELQIFKGKDIWLFGGGGLTDNFIKEDSVDQYIIGIIPIILGKGRRLFFTDNPTIELHLDACTVDDGITILQYSKRRGQA